MSGGTAAAASLALVAGLAGSIQVAVMGRFGERIGSFEALATSIAFSLLLATTVLLVLRQSLAGFGDAVRSPWWYWVGAVAWGSSSCSRSRSSPRGWARRRRSGS